MQLSIAAGTLNHPVPYEKYVDDSFAQGGATRRDHALTTMRSNLTRLMPHRSPAAVVAVRKRGHDGVRVAWARAPALKAGVFSPPYMAPEFSLRGSDGSDVTLARYRGKVVLLTFGFTHCAAVCPITLATLAQARSSSARRRIRCR